MSRCVALVVLSVALSSIAACQHGEEGSPAAGPATPLDRDIDRICNAEARSGALEQPEGTGRQVVIAQWLGANIESDDGHQFLVTIQPLEGAAKAKALREAATRAHLPACPLADSWAPPPAAAAK
jgi:hypothetical protein